MPYINLTANIKIPDAKKIEIEKEFGSVIGIIKGKSERWLMTSVSDSVVMTFAGSDAPCAIVSVALYGRAGEKEYSDLTSNLTEIVSKSTGIERSRIYVRYTEHDTFGWNGCNF